MRLKTRVFIFGIDGGSWNVLQPIMAKGKMPHLSKAVQKGIKGTIKAPLPPDTMPAWINFATGVNPGKHGCYSFFKINPDFNRQDIFLGDDVLTRRFYELLDEKGKKCILVNLPGSFPMRLKKGLGTASFLNPSSQMNWYPKSLEKEIPELKNYRIFPDLFKHQDDLSKRLVNEILDVEEKRFAVGKKLFKKQWDLFFYLVSGSDWLLHKAGAEFFSGQKEAVSFVESFFSRIDEILGWYLKNAKGVNVIILSDHGFKSLKGEFFINRWLIKEGFLKVNWEPKSALYQRDKIKALIERKMNQRPILQSSARLVFNKIPALFSLAGLVVYSFPQLFPKLTKMGLGELGVRIDIARSKAYSNGWFIRLAKLENRKKREKLRNRLIGKLKRLQSKDGRVFKNVYQREEVYSGEFLDEIPNLVMEGNDWAMDASVTRGEIFKKKSEANHSMEGVLVAFGPKIKPSRKRKKITARLIDIGPTVLKLFNQPIPRYMDGKRVFGF